MPPSNRDEVDRAKRTLFRKRQKLQIRYSKALNEDLKKRIGKDIQGVERLLAELKEEKKMPNKIEIRAVSKTLRGDMAPTKYDRSDIGFRPSQYKNQRSTNRSTSKPMNNEEDNQLALNDYDNYDRPTGSADYDKNVSSNSNFKYEKGTGNMPKPRCKKKVKSDVDNLTDKERDQFCKGFQRGFEAGLKALVYGKVENRPMELTGDLVEILKDFTYKIDEDEEMRRSMNREGPPGPSWRGNGGPPDLDAVIEMEKQLNGPPHQPPPPPPGIPSGVPGFSRNDPYPPPPPGYFPPRPPSFRGPRAPFYNNQGGPPQYPRDPPKNYNPRPSSINWQGNH